MVSEIRACQGCDGHGMVLVEAAYDYKTGQLVQEVADCPTCHGRGRVPLFLYSEPAPRTQRDVRGLTEGRLLFLCWHGTAKEKALAERELRRREARSR